MPADTRSRSRAGTARTRARAAARLAAVQALYQSEMEGTPVAALLHEFHQHRLGAEIEGVEYADADVDFFDDLVKGARARVEEIDALIRRHLSKDWSFDRLDRPIRAILRAGTYELIARPDVPVGACISEYVDVAHAFYERREAGFINGILDGVAKEARAA
ncbi:MAG TPA: transcription antitermination factor NusB [Sphingomonas sp.]|jgi:N utilization substance protein B